MKRIGLIPKYITMGNTQQTSKARTKENNNGRYSTNYVTVEEFDRDHDMIFNCLIKGKPAPKELVDKVAATVEELNLYL